MSFYPLVVCDRRVRVAPLFGDLLKGEPYVLDFSGAEDLATAYSVEDSAIFESRVFSEFRRAGFEWAMGRYLENRAGLLSRFPQMSRLGRTYHAGVDIVVDAGSTVFAPLEGIISAAGFDKGLGNYGGFVRIRHFLSNVIFESFFGHLDFPHLVAVGDEVTGGEEIGRLGRGLCSGGWFPHLHFQVLTSAAVSAGRLLEGYVDRETVADIEHLFPTPYSLFRY